MYKRHHPSIREDIFPVLSPPFPLSFTSLNSNNYILFVFLFFVNTLSLPISTKPFLLGICFRYFSLGRRFWDGITTYAEFLEGSSFRANIWEEKMLTWWRLDACSELGAEALYPCGTSLQHVGAAGKPHRYGCCFLPVGHFRRKTENWGPKIIWVALLSGERICLSFLKGHSTAHHSIYNSNYESLL